MILTAIVASDLILGSRDHTLIELLFKTKLLRGDTISVGRRTPEISSGEGDEHIWKASIQKRTANR